MDLRKIKKQIDKAFNEEPAGDFELWVRFKAGEQTKKNKRLVYNTIKAYGGKKLKWLKPTKNVEAITFKLSNREVCNQDRLGIHPLEIVDNVKSLYFVDGNPLIWNKQGKNNYSTIVKTSVNRRK